MVGNEEQAEQGGQQQRDSSSNAAPSPPPTMLPSHAPLHLHPHSPRPDQQQQPQQSPMAQASPPLLPPMQHYEAQRHIAAMQSQPQYAPVQLQQRPQYHPSHYSFSNGGLQPAPMPSNAGPTGPNGLMRFAIPPQSMDARQLAAGRQKKTVRRRTKTGCVTCRKRRIKCDELKPGCRNCEKSKRECLGYDLTSKPLTGQTPIQPAPSDTQPSVTPTLSSYPHNTLPVLPVAAGAFASTSSMDGMDYAPLDPQLGGDSVSTISGYEQSTSLRPERKVKSLTMNNLFALNNVPPLYSSPGTAPSITAEQQEEISEFYTRHYASGLDHLLETSWYSSEGLAHLRQDPELLDFVSFCLEHFKMKSDDPNATNNNRSLEARLVWQLIVMPCSRITDPSVGELLPRIEVLESLITGNILNTASIPSEPRTDQIPGTPASRLNELAFWNRIGCITAARDDLPDAITLREVDAGLNGMRSTLGMLESRDVLYSIAIARHIGGRLPEFMLRPLVAVNDDPTLDVNKLKVAHDFVEAEEQRGTTQVVQRVCSMALRAWSLQKQ